jgi:cytochrome c-type biogenesis protein CcmH
MTSVMSTSEIVESVGWVERQRRPNTGKRYLLIRVGSALRSTQPTLRRVALAFLLCLCALGPARAVEPGEMLQDPALEARARRLSQELRCVVCQNQSIDESNAPLAHDLRVIVRERLTAGDSDAQVLAFVEARYGEFVLLRPRFKPQTVLLWLAAPLLLAGAAIFLLRARSRRADAPHEAAPLSRDEQRRLDDLLRADGDAQRTAR